MTTLAPTHFCNQCGALWRQCDNGSWNLRSEKAGPCCDNVAMGEQIQPLVVPSPSPPPTDQSSREQEAPPVHRVHAERSYDQRAKAIIAFNTCTGDLDDKLEAAWLATLKEAKVSIPPTPITAEEAGREGEAKDGWVNVADRMPKRNRRVLAYFPKESTSVMDGIWDGERFMVNGFDRTHVVTHWHELPPAPAQSGGQGK